LPSSQQCTRESPNGTGYCTVLQTNGTCTASICGQAGSGISCTDAGTAVSTLATICADGNPGSTTASGTLIPFGHGELQMTISHS